MGRSIDPDVFVQVVHHTDSEWQWQGTLHTFEEAGARLRVRRPATGAVSGGLECAICGETVRYAVRSAPATRLRRRMWAALACLAAVVLVATSVSAGPLVGRVVGSPTPGPAFAVIGVLIAGFGFGLFGGVLFVALWRTEHGVRGPKPLRFSSGANEHALKYS
ncbi:hypothetical protein [Marinactinospora rubrisoli]|uniref:Uncharacterized protein n=1 Tax=Marinactinospora rubrisoli TaxID=2715399 RepID=A0ABW2KG93_9ACTN